MMFQGKFLNFYIWVHQYLENNMSAGRYNADNTTKNNKWVLTFEMSGIYRKKKNIYI